MRTSPMLAAALLLPLAARAQDTKTIIPKPPAAEKTDTPADDHKGKFTTRQELAAYYQERFADVDKERIKDLADLAPTLKDEEAEAAYAELFNLAVTRDQYEAAEKARRDLPEERQRLAAYQVRSPASWTSSPRAIRAATTRRSRTSTST